MSFIPSKCCLQGAVMGGTPRGEMERVSDSIQVDRYHAKPADGVVVSDEIAVVVFYDILGFSIPNPKIIADAYADKLKLNVYVPDYLPNPLPSPYIESSVEHYPRQKADQGWIGYVWDKVRLLPLLPLLPGIFDWKAVPLAEKAIADLQNEGYTQLVAIGYCRGGSMATHFLSKGEDSPFSAAVTMHPGWEPERLPKFRKPSLWILAEYDQFITPARREELYKAFEANTEAEFEHKYFPDTLHGFGSRPASEHEGMQKAFTEANDLAVQFLKSKLGL